MDNPPPSSSSSSTSVLVLALSLLGILTISLFLFLYYLFITKSLCFHIPWRRSPATPTLSPSHHRHHHPLPLPLLYSTSTTLDVRGRHGLTESTIQSIPTVCYKKGGHAISRVSFHEHECAVCINEFEDGEKIRLLPDCLHVFHLDCIDVWLQSNANCPLCRSSITACSPVALANLVGSTRQDVDASHGNSNNDIVIDIGDDELHASGFQARGSMGDECIDITRRNEDHLGLLLPMRRSFSMDSSNDKQLYLQLQKIMHQSALADGDDTIEDSSGSSSNNAITGKLRRGFFSFNQNRCSRSAVLPI